MAKERTMTYRASGKQVLKAGEYFADASTNEAARVIVAALNLPAVLDDRARRASLKGNRAMARVCRVIADDLRAGVMEERSEEHTSELQSLMRISYAVFCLKKKKLKTEQKIKTIHSIYQRY